MLFNRVEGFVAQVVLDFAGVVQGDFLTDAEAHEKLAEDGVALVDMGRDFFAFRGQVDVVILIDGDQPVFAHLAQDDGNRRAGIGKIRADINGVNLVLLLRENVDRFQIVFDGFGYCHNQIASKRRPHADAAGGLCGRAGRTGAAILNPL